MFYKKYLFYFIFVGTILPFIFLKDVYPFHRFGMFAEPIKSKTQDEKFYVFYKINNEKNNNDFVELKPQNIPLNANAFQMQLRKHHYQREHTNFITVFDKVIRKKVNLREKENLSWKWYHVIKNENSKDSVCVFSKQTS